MDLKEIEKIIKGIRNWKSLEILRNLINKRLKEEFDIE